MHDPYIRSMIVYALSGTLLTVLAVGLAVYRKKTYWKRARIRGCPEAKRREQQRR